MTFETQPSKEILELKKIKSVTASTFFNSICQEELGLDTMILVLNKFTYITEDQFSFQSQRRAMPKKIQTTAQLHSSHTLAK